MYSLISILHIQRQESLYSPGCPGTHQVNLAGLELMGNLLPLPASQVLGLQVGTTMVRLVCVLKDRILTENLLCLNHSGHSIGDIQVNNKIFFIFKRNLLSAHHSKVTVDNLVSLNFVFFHVYFKWTLFYEQLCSLHKVS